MRRTARRIYIVTTARFDSADSEDWEAEWRFSSERAANAFRKQTEGMAGIDSVNGPSPAPLWHSGAAAFRALSDEM